jgi:hypothetical protein
VSLSLCSGLLLVHSYESKQGQEEHAADDDENHDVPCFFFCVLD